MVALAERIELRTIEKLRPYERNPRTHSEAQVNQLAASMVEFGWTNPISIDEQARHPCRPRAAARGEEARARRGPGDPVRAPQRGAEASVFDRGQPARPAGGLERIRCWPRSWPGSRGESFDLDLVGFDATDLERLLALADGEAGPGDAEDEVPEPPEEPVSRPGDLWVLPDHRLLCGDATTLADVERVLGGQLADMCFTDSPYNVDYANSPKDKLRGKHLANLNDNLGSGFEAFLYDCCVNVLSVTKGAVYWCRVEPAPPNGSSTMSRVLLELRIARSTSATASDEGDDGEPAWPRMPVVRPPARQVIHSGYMAR